MTSSLNLHIFKLMNNSDFIVPADVPNHSHSLFQHHYNQLTHNTGRLMIFAGDQKVEHLNADFYGNHIAKDDSNPRHYFNIASTAKIGGFATQLGLIARYGHEYSTVPYVVKLNAHSNLVPTITDDPCSLSWYSIEQVMEFKKNSNLNILGIGYTIYLGSQYEFKMLKEAAQLIYQAHAHGLVTIIWAYPKGKSVIKPKDPHLIAGAAGVVATLGADFVKVNYPEVGNESQAVALKEAVAAAGNTKLICAGGPSTDPKHFYQDLYDQIHVSGAYGNATGRNIHQKPLDEAVRFCNGISAITLENKSVDEAMAIYLNKILN